jgi:choline dehydrogenase-like flavoprotein
MKTSFGSDFARRTTDAMPVESRGADVLQSLARGGLSNIWGANVVPFGEDDLRDWPLDAAALAPGYRAALAHVPLAAERDDDLAGTMPLYTDRVEPRPLSRQAMQVLRDLSARRDAVAARGLRFAPSRLALRTTASNGDPGCVQCGFCLHGCPLDVIWSSSHTLAHLERHPRFRYLDGHYVTRFVEHGDRVEVHAVRAADDAPARFESDRLFLGCGAFSTARLVLESLDRYDVDVTMLDSQYFLVPLLLWRSFAGASEERLTTLSQLCLRLSDPDVCPRDVHLLLYTFNPLYREVIRRTPLRFLPALERELLGRLVSLQGYLHSDVSPRLSVRLRRGGRALVVEGRENPETRAILSRVSARLRRLAGALRASPIPFLTRTGLPGKSYHAGGAFPMRCDPSADESDLLGRPAGLARVHLVDASVFPTIPATNITLTLMANAHRIAAASAALDTNSAKRVAHSSS